MKKILGAVCIILFSWTFQVHAEMRTWTSVKGDTIEAEFIKKTGNTVILKTSQGKQLKIPASGLSKADHEYLLGAIPPKIKITVKVDVDRDKQGDGYFFEETEESHMVSVSIKKTNREKSNQKFKAQLYIIAQSKKNSSEKKLIGYETHDFSFVDRDEANFSGTSKVTSTQSYYTKTGFRFEGYLVCVEDASGKVIAVDTKLTLYEKNLHNLKKASEGDLLSKDLSVLESASNNRRNRSR